VAAAFEVTWPTFAALTDYEQMHLLFLDESGKTDQGGLFALGGIAVRDTDWPELRRAWQRTLSEADWPLDREIKWHGIRKWLGIGKKP
jgi:hypothetical protein